MDTTAYFEHQIGMRRIKRAWVDEALASEVERRVQADGRIRVYGYVQERSLFMRVILLEDGRTLLNAFFGENYTRKRRSKP